MEKEKRNKYDICIIGGAGHVGLPLSVAFANSGLRTAVFDINHDALQKIMSGRFPFMEKGGDEALRSALYKQLLFAGDSPNLISTSRFVVIVVGTPIDEYLNPNYTVITRLLDKYFDYFNENQIIILRSTVYPGTTERVRNYFLKRGKFVKIAACPERISQGYALEELKTLPQIVSAFDDETLDAVSALFKKITLAEIIPVRPVEAELAKLFTNAWRYIKFAVGTQFLMIAQDHGLDYHKIEKTMKDGYARNSDLPKPGFTAGPCLLKDTMQLAAFANNNFYIGHAAMLVNEGLVNHVIKKLKHEHADSLKDKTLGILGMAFKADNDDHRDSLSYKIRKVAHVECKDVLCTDPYIKDPKFVSTDHILQNADIVILATPHAEYAKINPKNYPNIKFVDVWNFWGLSDGASGRAMFSA